MTTETVDTSELIERPTLYNSTQYSMVQLLLPNVTTAVAGGAGQTVVVSVVLTSTTGFPANLPSDTNYNVQAMPSQACAVSYSSKTTAGFTATLTPLNSGVTLSAGTCDFVVTYQNGGVN